MVSPTSTHQRRPPPIALPSTFSPPHQASAAVSFATTLKGREREKQGQSQVIPQLQQRPHTRDGSETPLLAMHQLENSAEPLPRSNSVSRFRESASTTFTNLIEHARGGLSPKKVQRKSDHSQGSAQASADGHNTFSTSRSRHADRAYRSDLSAVGEEQRTLRGEMEKQKERKLFKMMGTVPDTPRDGSFVPDGLVNTKDLRTSRDSKESNVSNKTGDAAPKSPKKKFLGISVPTFLSSNHVPIAPPIGVDSKALKVLGSSPPKRRKGRFSPHSPRAPKLSDSSKSLPGKVFDRYPPQYRRRHEIANYGSLARTRVRSPGRQSPTRSRSSPPRNGANDNPFERDDAVLPPTPPQKDTPERVKNRLLRDRQHKGNSTDAGMKMVHLPTMQLLEPRDSYGSSESPKKYCPKGAEDHAHLEHVEPVKSTYGVVEHTDTEVSELYTDEEGSSLLEDSSLLEGSSDPEDYRAFLDSHVPGNILPDSMLSDSQFDLPDPLQTPRVTRRRHSDLPLRTPVGALLTGRVQPEQLDFLKPTVYVPPPNDKRGGPFERFKKSDKIRLPLTILPKPLPSLEEDKQDPTRMTALHGNSNVSPPKAEHEENQVPTFAHRLMQPAHQIPNHSPYVNNATRPGPRPQSSSLTDMFDSMSLARIDSDNFRPSCLSAVPSPLRHGPDPSQPHPMGAHEYSRPKPSMAMDDHFFVTNEHIDVVACALWDKIAAQAKQQMDDSSKKHDKLLAVVDKHFEDFKVQISSINDQADRSATQVHNLNAQMHKTIEGIKKEVLSSVEAHTKRLTDMEQTVKELQKTVQDVQRMHEPNNAAAGYASPQGATNSFSLPNHSSQPSLAGYINSAGREPLSYQQQTHGYTEGHRPGNTSYMSRSAHVGREGKDDDNPFVRTNSYYPPSGVGGSSGFPQASQHHYDYSPHQEYQQYQNLQHHQQHYGANQGSTK